MRTVKLEVTGMSCGHCVQSVKEALAAVPGVTVENVQVGSASLTFDESKVTVADLVDAVYNAGYEASEAT